MKKSLVTLLMVGLGYVSWVQAADYDHTLYMSVRAQALGNAVTSSISDEQSLFLNPAGLAQVKALNFSLLNVGVEGSDALVLHSGDIMNLSNGVGLDSLNQLMGKNEFAKVQVSSTLAVLGFGMGLIGDLEVSSRLLNPVSPTGELGALGTYGFQAGYGFKLLDIAKGRGRLNFGIAGKYLSRMGKMQMPSLSAVIGLNKDALIGNFQSVGTAMGADAGLQLQYKVNDQLDFLSGLVLTDIGYTSFSNGVPGIASYFAAGMGLRLKSKTVVTTLTYDFQRITETLDWKKKNHLGLEVKFPILSLYGGMNGLFIPTYGLGLNLAILRLMLASTAQELGTTVGQNTERRYSAQLQLKFDL